MPNKVFPFKTDVVRRYQEGENIISIAESEGSSTKPVFNALKRSGVKYRHSLRKVQTLSLSSTEKAYIAGIVDGEGTIELKEKPKTQRWSNMRVSVVNTNKDIIEYLCLKIPDGHFYTTKRKFQYTSFVSQPKNAKVCYKFQLAKKAGVYKLLKSIFPYLIIKKEKAKKVVEWFENERGRYLKRKSRNFFPRFQE